MEQFNLLNLLGGVELPKEETKKEELKKKEEKKAPTSGGSTPTKKKEKKEKKASSIKVTYPVKVIGDGYLFEVNDLEGRKDSTLQELVENLVEKRDIYQLKMEEALLEYQEEASIFSFGFKETTSDQANITFPVTICYGRESAQYTQADVEEEDVYLYDVVKKFTADKGVPFDSAVYNPKCGVIALRATGKMVMEGKDKIGSVLVRVDGENIPYLGENLAAIKEKIGGGNIRLVKTNDEDEYCYVEIDRCAREFAKADVAKYITNAKAAVTTDIFFKVPCRLVLVPIGADAWNIDESVVGDKTKISATELKELINSDKCPYKKTIEMMSKKASETMGFTMGKDTANLGTVYANWKSERLG